MKDIDYFSQSRMNEDGLRTFVNKLPTRLKDETNNILGSGAGDLELMGYKGPYTNYGVQEIQFWHAAPVLLNAIPLLGPVIYGISRATEAASGLDSWHSVFFDEASGDMISSSEAQRRKSVNEEADKHQDRGVTYYRQQNYEQAFNEFKQAYSKCSSGYKNEQIFHTNRKNSANLWANQFYSDGIKFFNQENYKAAAEKFRKAHEVCENPSKKSDYQDDINHAEAAALNSEGIELRRQGKYDEAVKKFQAGINRCPVSKGSTKTLIKNNMAYAYYEDGKQKWNNAWSAEENGKGSDAREYFKKANELFKEAAQLDSNNSSYQKLVQISGLKIEGNSLFNEGVELQEQANQLKKKRMYQEARNKYQEAKDKFQRGYELSNYDSKFKTCIDLTQESIDEINQVIRNIAMGTGNNDYNEESDKTETTATVGVISSFKNIRG